MSTNAQRFHPPERPAPKTGRKRRPVRKQRRQTLAQQAAAYIDDELAHDRPIWRWRTHEHYEAVVYGSYASLPKASCLCHEDCLLELLAQMWPTHDEVLTQTVREELHIAQRYYQVNYAIAPTGVEASVQGLEGCVATAPTQAEARQHITEAIHACQAERQGDARMRLCLPSCFWTPSPLSMPQEARLLTRLTSQLPLVGLPSQTSQVLLWVLEAQP